MTIYEQLVSTQNYILTNTSTLADDYVVMHTTAPIPLLLLIFNDALTYHEPIVYDERIHHVTMHHYTTLLSNILSTILSTVIRSMYVDDNTISSTSLALLLLRSRDTDNSTTSSNSSHTYLSTVCDHKPILSVLIISNFDSILSICTESNSAT